MEQVLTEPKEPVKETKEEALAAIHLKTRAQQLIDETVKQAMIKVAFEKALRGGQQGLEELDRRLQKL